MSAQVMAPTVPAAEDRDSQALGVLFVLLGGTGREIGFETGLYTRYPGNKSLLVADTDLRSLRAFPTSDALPLEIPDIADLRSRPDRHREFQHITKYVLPDHHYSRSTDGTRSSPPEGHVAAAAAYSPLCEVLLNKVTDLGRHIPRAGREPTRVVILTMGFAGGGTFGGALPVFLAAQRRVREEVRPDIIVERHLAITLPSLYDPDRRAKVARALALLGGFTAVELDGQGVAVAGDKGDLLRPPLFEVAYLFGTLPDQRGVERELERQYRYIARALEALLDQRDPQRIGAQVVSWRRTLGVTDEERDIRGLPFRFSTAGVAEYVFHREASTKLLTHLVVHQMDEALAEGAVGAEEPAEEPGEPGMEEADSQFRSQVYALGEPATEALVSLLEKLHIPGSHTLIDAGEGWPGVSGQLEGRLSALRGQLAAEVDTQKRAVDRRLTNSYGAEVEAGRVLSPAGYRRLLSQWHSSRPPQRPDATFEAGKVALEQAEKALRDVIATPWEWVPWLWALLGPLSIFGALTGLWLIPLWLGLPQWSVRLASFVVRLPGLREAVLVPLDVIGLLVTFLILLISFLQSSPLFHWHRVEKARKLLDNRVGQRIGAFRTWAADEIGHAVDLYLRDEAERRSQSMERKVQTLKDGWATSPRLAESRRRYEGMPLWQGAALGYEKGHRASFSPLREEEWLTFEASKLAFGQGAEVERGRVAWQWFAGHVWRENRVEEVEKADAVALRDMISQWLESSVVAPAIASVPHVLELMKAGRADIVIKADQLLNEATPPLYLQPYSTSRDFLKARTRPFVQLPPGAGQEESQMVEAVLGLQAQPSMGDDPDGMLVLQVTGPFISYRMVAGSGHPFYEDVLDQQEMVRRGVSCPQILEIMNKTDVLGKVLGTEPPELGGLAPRSQA